MEHSDDPGSPNTSTFSARQYAHHTDTLRSKWECSEPGHTVCVPTRDNQHFRLDDRHVADWARALCAGTATTAEPPHALFEHIRGGFVWNRTNGGERVEAVSIAPSRRTASSIRGTSTVSSMNASSGVLGPGYLSGKMFKWFGTKGLDAVEDMFIMKRANGHVDTLRGWEKRPRALGDRERKEVYGMLTDALEMARQCYPAKVNRAAFNIGREVYLWLHAHPLIPQTPEMLRWLITVQICLIPLLLTRISAHDPLAADLAHSTLSALTRSPLSVDDPDIPADVICLVVRELAYARCAAQHAWLGFSLLSIIEMSIKVRGLMPREISAIGELVARRKHAHTPNARPHKKDRKASVTPDLSRPWEVALFAQCAALEHQDHSPASPTSPASPSPARALHDQPAHNTPQNPAATAVSPSQPDPSISASPITLFTSSVLGPAGLPSLLTALNTLLAPSTLHWENIALTVRALAALSLHGWVWEGIEGLERVEGEKGVVKALLGVFRPPVPTRWFCIRFWATDTLHNIVAHRPSIVRTLLHENALPMFASLRVPTPEPSSSSSPKPSSSTHPASPTVPNTPPSPHRNPPRSPSHNPPPSPSPSHKRHSSGSIRADLQETYKREAALRAEALSVYVGRWTEWTPDALPRLDVVRGAWGELWDEGTAVSGGE